MRAAKPLVLGIGAIAIATATYVHFGGARGVTVISDQEQSEGTFDRSQSAGLFIGVRKFEGAADVPFAVDDAVDLAYMFTFDRRASLLPPRNVVLLISGDPRKTESRDRLRKLRDAGARVSPPTTSNIRKFIGEQSSAAGENGMLILSVASHGFIDHEKTDSRILGSDAGFDSSALRLEWLIETTARSSAKRSLLFIDACRDRFRTDTRGASDKASEATALEKLMNKIHGQIVFYAAPAGAYAYDDRQKQNGVFTRAILDGLSCEATSTNGIITAGKLAEYVDRKVLAWVREHKDPQREVGIQMAIDGKTEKMPLAVCSCPPCTPLGPADVRIAGSEVIALDERDRPTWTARVKGEVAEAYVKDLDADHAREVIVRVGGPGADAGKVVLFDAQGHRRWTAGDGIHAMDVGEWSKHKHAVVTLSRSMAMTHLSIIDSAGNVDHALATPERFQDVVVGRPSNKHDTRIVVAGSDRLYLIDPPKFKAELLAIVGAIKKLTIVQRGKQRVVGVETESGRTTYHPFVKAPKELEAKTPNH